jgi:hypothetical protein
MAYREPKLQIFQDFEAALAAGAAPLHGCIIGPNYELHRFDEESEKAEIGEYDRAVSSSTVLWPDKVAGGVIDVDNATLWIEDALLRYYESIASAEVVTDNSNKIFSSVIFKSNSFADRTFSAFGNRDVQVGDTARVSWVESSSSQKVTFETTVAGFEADVVPGTADPDATRRIGFGDTTEGATESPSTTVPSKFITDYDTSLYDGLADGYPLDVYTIRVLEQGFDGAGGLDGTTLRITSAGNDVTLEVVLGSVDAPFASASSASAGNYEVPLGARGALLLLSDAGSGTIEDQATWDVTISQDYTEVDPASPIEFDVSGPYTGDKNTQYVMTVVLGGDVGTDDLVINVTTTNGADTTEQFTVPAADFASSSVNDYAIGIRGIEISFFDVTQWNTGDVIVWDVEAESEGAIHTLILRDPLPVATGIDLDLDLFVRDTFEFPSDSYDLTEDDITIFGNASYVTDILGTGEEPFPIFDGILYADYRELKTDDCNQVGAIDSITDVESILGPVSPLNPLAKGVSHALENSGGIAVFYIAICSDDLTGYTEALDILTENDLVHGLVPLSNDQDVKDLTVAHVKERSDNLNNQWRIAWFANNEPQVSDVYTELYSGDDILATVEEFSVGLYRKVVASGALFETNGVEAGDTLRINFSIDSEGNETYDEYIIDRVEDEETLILTTSLPGAITVAVKVEVWRNLSKTEYATALAQHAAQYNERRVYAVWADNPVENDGSALDLIYLAAALAGQRSGIPPHAPMSNLDVAGIALDPQLKFSRTQLNTIAAGGVWIVVKDFTGRVYTRHQLSTITNPDDLNQREQSKTTNLDHISRDFRDNTQDLFGQGNISPEMLALIRQRVNSLIEKISNRSYPAKIGPQMLDAEILTLAVDEVLRDSVIVEINPDMPDPLNELTIRFKVS